MKVGDDFYNSRQRIACHCFSALFPNGGSCRTKGEVTIETARDLFRELKSAQLGTGLIEIAPQLCEFLLPDRAREGAS